MPPIFTTVLPELAAEVGDLVFEAFRDIAQRHNFEPPFSTPRQARGLVRMLAQIEGWESYLLVEDGRPLACNFGDERDQVVGVGPVAVAVDHQGRGLGRRVMEALLEHAERGGFASVRLVQAAYNMQSFSLYHNLGFQVQDVLALLRGRPREDQTPLDRVRDYTAADLPACDALHREVLGVNRHHDIESMANLATPIVLERNGQLAGYLTRFPGDEAFISHGAARDERALRDLLIGMARAIPGDLRLQLPVSQAKTLRWAMGHGQTQTRVAAAPGRGPVWARRGGFRLMELGTYMVRGDYQAPMGAWLPSPFY